LASAGRRAFGRTDFGVATGLLTRAVDLVDVADPTRSAMLVDLAEAARESGRFGAAEAAVAAADASPGRDRVRALVVIARLRLRLDADPGVDLAEAENEARRAADTAEASRDDEGAAAAWRLLWHLAAYRCRYAEAGEAARRAAVHAERAGDPRWMLDRRLEVSAAVRGAAPTSLVIALGDEVLTRVRGKGGVASGLRSNVGLAHAMRGDFELARELMLQALAAVDEHSVDAYALQAELGSMVEALRGDLEAAERELRKGLEGLTAARRDGRPLYRGRRPRPLPLRPRPRPGGRRARSPLRGEGSD